MLRNKKIRGWCLFDFGISSYPTLIVTFFYGAFYAKNIAMDPISGASDWGLAITLASILSLLLLLFVFLIGKKFVTFLSVNFFKFFFYVLVIACSGLYFFDKGSNPFLPLILIVLSFVCFEMLNLFYNASLHKILKNNHGFLSNLGWAFGYLGGLISLLIVFLFLRFSSIYNFEINDSANFLLIGPFVALWTLIFGSFHFMNTKKEKLKIPDILNFYPNIKRKNLRRFLFSYFFINNGVICIFAFASMFASFIFGLTELEILYLGIFINLSGIIGCLIMGNYDKNIGSEKNVLICSLILTFLTVSLFFIKGVFAFWVIALLIGFFVGPIQASSRAVISSSIDSSNQLGAFAFYSILGNISAIMGPFAVSLVIDIKESIQYGILVIPILFFISLIPYFKSNV